MTDATIEYILALRDEVSAGLKNVQGELRASGEAAQGSGGVMQGAFSFLTGGLLLQGINAVTSGLSGMFHDAMDDAREAAGGQAQLDAALRSTQGAVGMTRDQLLGLSDDLSAAKGASNFSSNAVLGFENLLLTFTNVKGKIFDEATQIGVDMAQAMGAEPQAEAIQLGKALNDPVKGITALTRVGVTFTEQQKNQIAAMEKAGNTAGAQQVILNELNKEFGGSARAAAEASDGSMQLHESMKQVLETLGGALLPVLREGQVAIAGLLNAAMPTIEALASGLGGTLTNAIDTVKGAFDAFSTGMEGDGGIAGGLSNLLYSLDTVTPLFDTLGDAVVNVATVLDSAQDAFNVGAVDGLSAGLSNMLYSLDTLSPAFDTLGDVVAVVGGALEASLPLVQSFVQVLLGVGDISTVTDSLTTFGDTVTGIITNVFGPEAAAAVQPFFDLLSVTLPQAIDGVQATFASLNGADLSGIFTGAASAAQPLIDLFAGVLPGAVTLATDALTALGPVVEAVPALFDAIVGTVTTVTDSLVSSFGALIPQAIGIFNQAVAIIGPAMQGAGQIAGEAVAALTAMWQAEGPLIATVVQGIAAVISAVFGQISTFLAAHGAEISATMQNAWTQISQIIATTTQIVITVVQALTPVVQTVFTEMTAFITAHGTQIQAVLTVAWNTISTLIKATLTVIQGIVNTVMAAVQGNWTGVWAGIQQTTQGATQGLTAVITGALNSILAIFGTSLGQVLNTVTTTFTNIYNTASAALNNVVKAGSDAGVALHNALAAQLTAIGTAFNSTLSTIESTWSGFASKAEGIGRNIVQGLMSGLRDMAQPFIDAAKRIVEDAISAMESAANINSPSKETRDRVAVPLGEGLIAGIVQTAPQVMSAMAATVTNAVDAAQSALSTAGAAVATTGGSFVQNLLQGVIAAKPQVANVIGGLTDDATKTFNEKIKQLQGTLSGLTSNQAKYTNVKNADDTVAIEKQQGANLAITDDFTTAANVNTKQYYWGVGDDKRWLKQKGLTDKDLTSAGYLKSQVSQIKLDPTQLKAYTDALNDAKTKSDDLAQTDTKAASEYFALKSSQLKALGDLDVQINQARANGDDDVVTRLQAQRDQIASTQDDETNALLANIDKEKQARKSQYDSQVKNARDAYDAEVKAMGDATTAAQKSEADKQTAIKATLDSLQQQAEQAAETMRRTGLSASASLYKDFASAIDSIGDLQPKKEDLDKLFPKINPDDVLSDILKGENAAASTPKELGHDQVKKELGLVDLKAPTVGTQSNAELLKEQSDYAAAIADQETKINAEIARRQGLLDSETDKRNKERDAQVAAYQAQQSQITGIATDAQSQLAAVQQQAMEIAKTDPKSAQAYFELYQGHIEQIAKLQESQQSATTDDQKTALQGQIDDLNKAFDFQKQLYTSTVSDNAKDLQKLVDDANTAATKTGDAAVTAYAGNIATMYNSFETALTAAVTGATSDALSGGSVTSLAASSRSAGGITHNYGDIIIQNPTPGTDLNAVYQAAYQGQQQAINDAARTADARSR